jgi:glycosyltransferase involved in cell wall biosynthesis
MNKIFDSMMAGKPILCAITTPDDLILRNKAGVMVPSDAPRSIDAVIASWEVMPEEQLREMGESGHAAAMDQYSYQHLAKRFAELF